MPPVPGGLVSVALVWLAAAGVQDSDRALLEESLVGGVEAVRSLLATAAPALDATDEEGRTALMYAVQGGHHEIVEILLQAGASLDQQDLLGRTALHLAARLGRTDSARVLLRAGADFELRDSEGRTPLYRAIEARRAEVIEMVQAAALARGSGVRSEATLGLKEQALPPRIVESTPAPYTESALAEGVEGSVVLMVLVRRDGSIGAATVSQGLEPSLEESALRTVKDWKFAPAMRHGKTVEVVLEVEVRFQLPSDP